MTTIFDHNNSCTKKYRREYTIYLFIVFIFNWVYLLEDLFVKMVKVWILFMVLMVETNLC